MSQGKEKKDVAKDQKKLIRPTERRVERALKNERIQEDKKPKDKK